MSWRDDVGMPGKRIGRIGSTREPECMSWGFCANQEKFRAVFAAIELSFGGHISETGFVRKCCHAFGHARKLANGYPSELSRTKSPVTAIFVVSGNFVDGFSAVLHLRINGV